MFYTISLIRPKNLFVSLCGGIIVPDVNLEKWSPPSENQAQPKTTEFNESQFEEGGLIDFHECFID